MDIEHQSTLITKGIEASTTQILPSSDILSAVDTMIPSASSIIEKIDASATQMLPSSDILSAMDTMIPGASSMMESIEASATLMLPSNDIISAVDTVIPDASSMIENIEVSATQMLPSSDILSAVDTMIPGASSLIESIEASATQRLPSSGILSVLDTMIPGVSSMIESIEASATEMLPFSDTLSVISSLFPSLSTEENIYSEIMPSSSLTPSFDIVSKSAFAFHSEETFYSSPSLNSASSATFIVLSSAIDNSDDTFILQTSLIQSIDDASILISNPVFVSGSGFTESFSEFQISSSASVNFHSSQSAYFSMSPSPFLPPSSTDSFGPESQSTFMASTLMKSIFTSVVASLYPLVSSSGSGGSSQNSFSAVIPFTATFMFMSSPVSAQSEITQMTPSYVTDASGQISLFPSYVTIRPSSVAESLTPSMVSPSATFVLSSTESMVASDSFFVRSPVETLPLSEYQSDSSGIITTPFATSMSMVSESMASSLVDITSFGVVSTTSMFFESSQYLSSDIQTVLSGLSLVDSSSPSLVYSSEALDASEFDLSISSVDFVNTDSILNSFFLSQTPEYDSVYSSEELDQASSVSDYFLSGQMSTFDSQSFGSSAISFLLSDASPDFNSYSLLTDSILVFSSFTTQPYLTELQSSTYLASMVITDSINSFATQPYFTELQSSIDLASMSVPDSIQSGISGYVNPETTYLMYSSEDLMTASDFISSPEFSTMSRSLFYSKWISEFSSLSLELPPSPIVEDASLMFDSSLSEYSSDNMLSMETSVSSFALTPAFTTLNSDFEMSSSFISDSAYFELSESLFTETMVVSSFTLETSSDYLSTKSIEYSSFYKLSSNIIPTATILPSTEPYSQFPGYVDLSSQMTQPSPSFDSNDFSFEQSLDIDSMLFTAETVMPSISQPSVPQSTPTYPEISSNHLAISELPTQIPTIDFESFLQPSMDSPYVSSSLSVSPVLPVQSSNFYFSSLSAEFPEESFSMLPMPASSMYSPSISPSIAPSTVVTTPPPSANVTTSPETTDSTVTTVEPSPTRPSGPNLMIVQIKPNFGDDPNSPEFKTFIQRGLLKGFLIAKGIPVERRRRRAVVDVIPPNDDNYEVSLEYLEPNNDGTADAIFYIYDTDTGERVPSDEAEEIYERIDRAELSSYVGAYVVGGPIPLDEFGSEPDGAGIPIWVYILAALAALALIIILISLINSYKHGLFSAQKYEEREPLPPELVKKSKQQRKDRGFDIDKQRLIMEAENTIQQKKQPVKRQRTLSIMADDPDHETSQMGEKLYGKELRRKGRHKSYGAMGSTSAPSTPDVVIMRRQMIPVMPEAPASDPTRGRRSRVPMVEIRGPIASPELALDAPPIVIKTRTPPPRKAALLQRRSAPDSHNIEEPPNYSEAPTLPIRRPGQATDKDPPPIVIKMKDPSETRSSRRERDYFSGDEPENLEEHINMSGVRESSPREKRKILSTTSSFNKEWDYDADDDSVFLPMEPVQQLPTRQQSHKKSKSEGAPPEYNQTVWIENEVPEEEKEVDKFKLLRKKAIKVKAKHSAKVEPELIPMQEMTTMSVGPYKRKAPPPPTETTFSEMIEHDIDIPVTRFWLAPPEVHPSAFSPVSSQSPATEPEAIVTQKPPKAPVRKTDSKKRKKLPTPPPKDIAEEQERTARKSLMGLRKNLVSPTTSSEEPVRESPPVRELPQPVRDSLREPSPPPPPTMETVPGFRRLPEDDEVVPSPMLDRRQAFVDDDSLSIAERSLDVLPKDRLPLQVLRRAFSPQGRSPYMSPSGLDDTLSIDSMEMDFQSAGLFEHVAKMSRLAEPAQPSYMADPFSYLGGTGVPPVRYKSSFHQDSSASSLSMPSSPLPWPEVKRRSSAKKKENSNAQDDQLPVKLRRHPVANKDAELSTESEADSAARENKKMKHRRKQETPAEKITAEKSNEITKKEGKSKKKKERKRKPKKSETSAQPVEPTDDPRDSAWSMMSPNSVASAGSTIGRNMRAAPKSRTVSEAGSIVSQRSSTKEQELLSKLHQQQLAAVQQEQMRRVAQDMINQAYQQDVRQSQLRQQKDHENATHLLNEAFALTGPQPAVPQSSPPSQPENSANPRRGSALQRLLAEGSLSRTPTTAIQPSPNVAASNPPSEQRDPLLSAIREEFQMLQPPSNS